MAKADVTHISHRPQHSSKMKAKIYVTFLLFDAELIMFTATMKWAQHFPLKSVLFRNRKDSESRSERKKNILTCFRYRLLNFILAVFMPFIVFAAANVKKV